MSITGTIYLIVYLDIKYLFYLILLLYLSVLFFQLGSLIVLKLVKELYLGMVVLALSFMEEQ